MTGFEQALKKLVEDPHFRAGVERDHRQMVKEFKLDAGELFLLMQVWHATTGPETFLPGGIDLCHCCCSTR
jgi:hypothetical protein